ncbi:MAG: PRC-barrel domain-containing protein [Dehalococcoidia bacterium]
MVNPETRRDQPEMVEEAESGIKDQNWFIVDPGSTVVTADGEEIGSVRERMPQYLEVRVHKNLLADEEMYVPRTLVDRVEDGRVILDRTRGQLEEMDLTTTPALKEQQG